MRQLLPLVARERKVGRKKGNEMNRILNEVVYFISYSETNCNFFLFQMMQPQRRNL